MDNEIISELTDETKSKLRDFNEQEAYFLLCQIFSNAQATKDYAKFQSDLTEWKKRFPLELFSENYKIKIKYMFSNEFLDTVLKNFIAFSELSKKDPSKGLQKLRKIFANAEKHKDSKTLDKDLEELYKEYPLKYLKEKYPHILEQILSKANRERVLQKFDSADAFKLLENIVSNSDKYADAQDFKNTIEEWQKLFPIPDFKQEYQDRVQKTLNEFLDDKKLEELYPTLDLTDGTVIPIELQPSIKNMSIVAKDALREFFKITNKNIGDINSLFDWMCKYNRYINSFDTDTKNSIVGCLMTKYAYDLPPVGTKYEIPKMDSGVNELLSLSDFQSIDDTKKEALIQLLGILSTGKELTHEDNYRLDVINSNVQKIKIMEKAKMDAKVELFVEKFPEEKLTPNDNIYLAPTADSSLEISVENDVDITVSTDNTDNVIIEEENVHTSDDTSFKTALKIEETLEKININPNTSGSSEGSSSSGGSSVSNSTKEVENDKQDSDNSSTEEIEEEIGNTETKEVSFFERLTNFIKHKPANGEDRDDR